MSDSTPPTLQADPADTVQPEPIPVQLSLATPSDWIHLDLSDNAFASARRLVDRLTEGQKQTDERLKLQMVGALQSTVRQSREQGGVLAAFWSRSLSDQTVGASVIAAVTPLGDRVARNPDGSIDLEAAFKSVAGTGPRTDDGSGVIIESELVEIPAGPAIRVRKRQEADALGSKHETQVVQFFLLVPDQAKMVVLTFSTPTLDLADALMDLFDAMAGSLRFRL